jgi:ribosomal protein S18 acetylase RimI-like enzyme
MNANKTHHLINMDQVTVRRALPDDRPSILTMVNLIWGSEDYIPQVLDEWQTDTQGCLLVAANKNEIIGLAKLSILAPNAGWIEGLRVHPAFRQQGVASALFHALVDIWEQSHQGPLRMITEADNTSVQRLCSTNNFSQMSEFQLYSGAPLRDADVELEPVNEYETEQAVALASRNPLLPPELLLMDIGWQWAPPTSALLEKAIHEKRAYWWLGRSGLLMTYDNFDENGVKSLCGQYAVCQPGQLRYIARALRGLAAAQGAGSASWTCWKLPGWEFSMEQAGYERQTERLLLFERESRGERFL